MRVFKYLDLHWSRKDGTDFDETFTRLPDENIFFFRTLSLSLFVRVQRDLTIYRVKTRVR